MKKRKNLFGYIILFVLMLSTNVDNLRANDSDNYIDDALRGIEVGAENFVGTLLSPFYYTGKLDREQREKKIAEKKKQEKKRQEEKTGQANAYIGWQKQELKKIGEKNEKVQEQIRKYDDNKSNKKGTKVKKKKVDWASRLVYLIFAGLGGFTVIAIFKQTTFYKENVVPYLFPFIGPAVVSFVFSRWTGNIINVSAILLQTVGSFAVVHLYLYSTNRKQETTTGYFQPSYGMMALGGISCVGAFLGWLGYLYLEDKQSYGMKAYENMKIAYEILSSDNDGLLGEYWDYLVYILLLLLAFIIYSLFLRRRRRRR